MTAFRSAIFTILVPGTVVVLIPWAVLRGGDGMQPTSSAMLWIPGALAAAAGAVLYFVCLAGFVRHGRGTPAPTDPPRQLVVRGPYRFTRNPMYVAVLLIVVGEALVFGAAGLALYAALLAAAFHLFVVGYEEPTLSRLFGAEYDAYRRSVPRWLGRRRTHGPGPLAPPPLAS
jgi:protein-S-isoprenylcysteine O-methyltransferase Ste14